MKICNKHESEYDGRAGCRLCYAEEQKRRAQYDMTLTDAKKLLAGISTEQLLKLCPDYLSYKGMYGLVRKFRKADILKIAETWIIPDSEKEKRREYTQRSKRTEIEFYCEECGEMIRSLPGSRAFESFFVGQIKRGCNKVIKECSQQACAYPIII